MYMHTGNMMKRSMISVSWQSSLALRQVWFILFFTIVMLAIWQCISISVLHHQCMTVYDSAWQWMRLRQWMTGCMTAYDNKWQSARQWMTMYGEVYGRVWLSLTVQASVWQCMIAHGGVWQCTAVNGSVWHSAWHNDGARQCMIVHDSVWQCMKHF